MLIYRWILRRDWPPLCLGENCLFNDISIFRTTHFHQFTVLCWSRDCTFFIAQRYNSTSIYWVGDSCSALLFVIVGRLSDFPVPFLGPGLKLPPVFHNLGAPYRTKTDFYLQIPFSISRTFAVRDWSTWSAHKRITLMVSKRWDWLRHKSWIDWRIT